MDSWPDALGKTTEPQASRNSGPQEGVGGPVQLTIMAWNSDSISDSQFSSVQFSRSVVSNSLRPHESQHARPPCPTPTPGVHSDSRPLSQ